MWTTPHVETASRNTPLKKRQMERQERWDDEKEDISNCWMKETSGYFKLKEEELNHVPGEL